ncbi:FAD/NAD(P)-binding protein [Granulosicoccus sp. 3-233]|uniref:FAD/NAD(P)-binding protein n=1 Tax=Granulosicoccus sp. 3-233 TaxID=3417969 RepID=UPI003D32D509
MSRKRVGIVGCGAMGLYSLKHLVESQEELDIHIFDSAAQPGCGMPYSEGLNADYMLCNAFSREIPPLTRTLAQWLKTQSAVELDEWESSPDDVDARAFYPRTLIGRFLIAEFKAVCEAARKAGHRVHALPECRVNDIVVDKRSATVVLGPRSDSLEVALDTVIIATGHDWPTHPTIGDVELLSPWPYTNIERQLPGQIGILGSSLSAVDIVVALGHAHGSFIEQPGQISWKPNTGVDDMHVTMVSRDGIMPEGDFHYPFPYEPLDCITKEAVTVEVERGKEGLLGRVFQLLLDELAAADPDYLDHLGAGARTIEGFASAYFRDREQRGGLEAVRDDLQAVRESMRREETIAYRYALLRGHENVEIALPHLYEQDWKQFREYLLPVFADCYAAVPHLSIARILAMHRAGVLSIVASGDEASFTRADDGRITVDHGGKMLRFDCMFDARGQSPASLSKLPFPSLTAILDDGNDPIRAPFRVAVSPTTDVRVYCLALPQLLERYPFSQGLPNCCELSKTAVEDALG